MLTISATEFIRKFRRYNLEAQRESVAITNHGKIDGYYMSAGEYEELQKLKSAMRRSYTLNTLPDHLYAELVSSKVDPRFDHLNELLDDNSDGPS